MDKLSLILVVAIATLSFYKLFLSVRVSPLMVGMIMIRNEKIIIQSELVPFIKSKRSILLVSDLIIATVLTRITTEDYSYISEQLHHLSNLKGNLTRRVINELVDSSTQRLLTRITNYDLKKIQEVINKIRKTSNRIIK